MFFEDDGDKDVDNAKMSMCEHFYQGDGERDVDTANVPTCL